MALHSSMEPTEWAVYVAAPELRKIGRVRLAYETGRDRLRYAADYMLPTGAYFPVGTYSSAAGARRALARRYEKRMAGTSWLVDWTIKPTAPATSPRQSPAVWS